MKTYKISNKIEYKKYLKGMYFGILKDCEKGKNFNGIIDSAIVELIGISQEGEIEKDCLSHLIARTAALKYLNYNFLKKTILNECMPLIDELFRESEI